MSSRSRAAAVLSTVFAGLYLSSCATVTQGTT